MIDGVNKDSTFEPKIVTLGGELDRAQGVVQADDETGIGALQPESCAAHAGARRLDGPTEPDGGDGAGQQQRMIVPLHDVQSVVLQILSGDEPGLAAATAPATIASC